MKRHFLCCLLGCMAFAASAQIPNAGFEDWTTTGGYNSPVGWDNMNALTAGHAVYTCAKASPGYAGTDYLQLVTQSVPGMGSVPGVAVSGVMNRSTYQPVSGFAFSGRPASLTGAWQYMATGADRGYIAILLTRWNQATNARDTVAYTYQPLVGMVMLWATFSIPVNYVSGAMPDSASITLSSSGATPVTGSYLLVDALAFTGNVPTSVVPVGSEKSTVTVYPNPATDVLQISGIKGSVHSLAIFNAMGQLMERLGVSSSQLSVPVANLPCGTYFLSLAGAEGNEVVRFVKAE